MIIIQLREPGISLFVKADYEKFLKENASSFSPFIQVKTLRDRKAIILIGDKTNIAYFRETDQEEMRRMMTPLEQQQIQPAHSLIIGKGPGRPQ